MTDYDRGKTGKNLKPNTAMVDVSRSPGHGSVSERTALQASASKLCCDRRDPISIASSGRGVIRRLRLGHLGHLGHLGLQESGITWNNIYYIIYYSIYLSQTTCSQRSSGEHGPNMPKLYNQNESKLYL